MKNTKIMVAAILESNMAATRGLRFSGSTSKINCMGLYFVCTKFGAFLKNVMIDPFLRS